MEEGRTHQSLKSRNRELWMVNQFAVSRDMHGGTRHIELGELLKTLGWDTTIVAQSNNDRPPGDGTAVNPDVVDYPRFEWIRTMAFKDNGLTRYLNMAMFMLGSFIVLLRRSRPDVIMGSSPSPLAALSALLIAKIRSVPFVLEIRDLWPDSLVQLGFRNRPLIWMLYRLEMLLYRSASHVVALTVGIQDGIIAKGIEPGKITLVPNASLRPDPVDRRNREEWRTRLGWNEKIVAIWPGAHNHANGLEYVVEAALSLKDKDDILVVFIGEGTEKQALKEMAKGSTNISFLDSLPKQQLNNVLAAADIGILNSRAFEAFAGARPNKLFEYFANSLAIVNSLPGEASNLIQESGAGIDVIWENPASIAAGIVTLANDSELRKKMGQNGFEYVTENHSREDTAETLASVLEFVSKGMEYR